MGWFGKGGWKSLATPAIAAGLVLGLSAAVLARRPSPNDSPPVNNPLGDVLPAVQLKRADGTPVSLADRLAGRPALLFVTSLAECRSCSNLPIELRVLKREAPQLETVLVGSGASAAEFRAQFEKMGVLPSDPIVDEHDVLLTRLGLGKTTLVLLADSAGRILFVDSRTPPDRAAFPIGRVIHDLTAALQPSARSSGLATR
jgi:peroxiredoxin